MYICICLLHDIKYKNLILLWIKNIGASAFFDHLKLLHVFPSVAHKIYLYVVTLIALGALKAPKAS